MKFFLQQPIILVDCRISRNTWHPALIGYRIWCKISLSKAPVRLQIEVWSETADIFGW